MESAHEQKKSLSVLMASGVPRRREGGVAAIIYNLGREIEHLGHQVTYLFQEDLIPSGTVSPRFNELIFSFRLARYIADKRKEFSIVDVHAPVGFVYGGRRRQNRHDYPPYVMTLHGLEERRVHAMSREVRKGRAWHYSWKNRLWHKFYHQPRFRACIRTADGAHAYSRDVWNMLQLKYDLDSDRVSYIPNGVEPRFFLPRQYRGGDDVKLLYAGTWLDQRGIFYLRDALRNLKRSLPRFTMTIAGGAAPAEEIQQFFGANLQQHVIVRPVVSWEEMPQLYLEHDIFLFPSLMEGLPSVLLEAMATGMPVITTETCGMPDVVEDGFNGRLIPPADAVAIEEAALFFANSQEMRERLGTAARETMKRYTWERAGRQLEALYLRVLAKERAGSA